MRQELAKVTGPTDCGQVVLGHFEFPELENLIPNLATSATLLWLFCKFLQFLLLFFADVLEFLPLGSGEDGFHLLV